MKRSDLKAAVVKWLEHKKWNTKAPEEIPCRHEKERCFTIDAYQTGKNNRVTDEKSFLVFQSWVWFDPIDLEEHDDILLPTADFYKVPCKDWSYIVFNNARTFALAFSDEVDLTWRAGERYSVRTADTKIVPVPWKCWSLDYLREDVARGWPILDLDKRGDRGKPETWQFVPTWTKDAQRKSEQFIPLPDSVDDLDRYPSKFKDEEWYLKWLETKDESFLPWVAV